MLNVFLNVVLPVFLMAGVGALLRRWRQVPSGPISVVTLYVFAPALVFNSLATTSLSTVELGRIALFGLSLAGVMYLLSLGTAHLLRMDRAGVSAFLLATMFMNAGNYGLPVALFAFGQGGLERAVVFFVVQATLGGTLAVYLASRSHLNARDALRSVTRMPMVYATLAGLAINLLGLQVPAALGGVAKVLGNAAVPSMLMVLGLQMAERFSLEDGWALAASSSLRLVASGGIAYLLTLALRIAGLTQQVLMVNAAMPTAVFTTILASEFQARPSFVTSAVVATTAASMATLTVLITVVQRLA